MKTKLALIAIVGLMFSCVTPELREGEIQKVNNNDSIELFRYKYSDEESSVIIARFKNKPVITVNQTIRVGKTIYNQANIVIENDSVIVIKKP